jgi:hypothetical protein
MSRTYKDSLYTLQVRLTTKSGQYISRNYRCPQCEVDLPRSWMKASKDTLTCPRNHTYTIDVISEEDVMIEFTRKGHRYYCNEDFTVIDVYINDKGKPETYEVCGLSGLIDVIKRMDRLQAFA